MAARVGKARVWKFEKINRFSIIISKFQDGGQKNNRYNFKVFLIP
jgi:hypothetical protein